MKVYLDAGVQPVDVSRCIALFSPQCVGLRHPKLSDAGVKIKNNLDAGLEVNFDSGVQMFWEPASTFIGSPLPNKTKSVSKFVRLLHPNKTEPTI